MGSLSHAVATHSGCGREGGPFHKGVDLVAHGIGAFLIRRQEGLSPIGPDKSGALACASEVPRAAPRLHHGASHVEGMGRLMWFAAHAVRPHPLLASEEARRAKREGHVATRRLSAQRCGFAITPRQHAQRDDLWLRRGFRSFASIRGVKPRLLYICGVHQTTRGLQQTSGVGAVNRFERAHVLASV